MYNTTDLGNPFAVVSDTPDMVAGELLGVTNNSDTGLRLHRHNFFLLDDGDGTAPNNVAEGVYLLALQIDMPGHGITKPIFVVPGTYGLVSTSLPTLEAAVDWVEENARSLIRDGDYNFDGVINSADGTTWTHQFASDGPWPINGDFANGNRDSIVDAADYVIWRKFAGGGPGALTANSTLSGVPEPTSVVIFGCAAAAVMLFVRRRW
jgi:hypothetical protein